MSYFLGGFVGVSFFLYVGCFGGGGGGFPAVLLVLGA